jgi:hypothetical protein
VSCEAEAAVGWWLMRWTCRAIPAHELLLGMMAGCARAAWRAASTCAAWKSASAWAAWCEPHGCRAPVAVSLRQQLVTYRIS